MQIYRLLTGEDDASFCKKVTKALSEGWGLYGSPQYSYDNANARMVCAQAVVKEVKNQPFEEDKKLTDY